MHQLEVPRLALPHLIVVPVDQLHVKQRVVVPRDIVLRHGGELLVRRHEWGRDVVREQERVGLDVPELDEVVVAHDAAAALLGERLRRDDLPVVVCVGVRVAGDLLPGAADAPVVVAQRVVRVVRVQEDFRVLVLDRDNVVIAYLWVVVSVVYLAG